MKNIIANKVRKWLAHSAFNALYRWSVIAPISKEENQQVINTLDILRKHLYNQ